MDENARPSIYRESSLSEASEPNSILDLKIDTALQSPNEGISPRPSFPRSRSMLKREIDVATELIQGGDKTDANGEIGLGPLMSARSRTSQG